MERTSLWRWPLAPVGLLFVFVVSCRCEKPDKQLTAEDLVQPERPITKTEDDARKDFLTFLGDPKLDIVLEESRRVTPAAMKALDATFAGLDEKLVSKLDLSRAVKCVHNGCFKDVVYADWATYNRVNEAVLFGHHQSAFVQYPGTQYRTGRSQEPGGRFVVTWALLFPRGGGK